MGVGGKINGLLTKCEVKMAGYWPSSFLCVFMSRYLDRTSLVNTGFIIWLSGKFFLRRSGSQSQRPLTELAV